MQVTLKLFISVILEAVKTETQLKGRIDKAQNPQLAELAHHETAGDEAMHERKLMRGIYTSLDKLKVAIIDFLEQKGTAYGDNAIASDINEQNDTITITLALHDRFNGALADTLARLCSKYIEDSTLVFWWGATGIASQAQFYQALLVEDFASITRAFTKKPAFATEIPYTSKISVEASEIHVLLGEEFDLTYAIDGGCRDDIYFQSPEGIRGHHAIEIVGSLQNGFVCKAKALGAHTLRLTSAHDDSVYTDIIVIVQSLDGKEPYPSYRHL